MMRLLDEFGDRDDVRRYLTQNMHTFGWCGSLTSYYALYEEPSVAVRPSRGRASSLGENAHAQMRNQVETAKRDDDEHEAQWNA